MESNQFDDKSNPGEKAADLSRLNGRAYEFMGKPGSNGRYSNTNSKDSLNQTQPQAERATVLAESDPYLTIVIPAYNEATRLPATLDQVLKWLESQKYSSEVIIVDDGSADETAAIVQRLIQQRQAAHYEAEQSPHCQLRLIENSHKGKGYAVRTGMLQGRGNFVLFSDADLCTPISEATKLLFWLDQGFDVAIGSREGVGARRYGEPIYRHLMGRVFNLIVRVVTSSPFQDTQCGFKAFTHRSAHDLFHRVQLYGDNTRPVQGAMVTGFDVEVLFLAIKRNYRVKEVPVEWYHVKGSKVSPVKDSLRMLRDITSVRLNDIRGFYKK